MNTIVRFVAWIAGLLPRRLVKRVAWLQWQHPVFARLYPHVAGFFRNQDGTIQQGAGKGLRFNVGGANVGCLLGTFELAVQDAFVEFVAPGMTVYDVGANVGFYTVIAARLAGPDGRVVAFEPHPANARQISHNARLNPTLSVEVRAEALGAFDGQTVFHLSEEATWGQIDGVRDLPRRKAGELTVPLRRLDSFDGILPPPALIKIDVEQAEVGVLEGGRETIRQRQPILFIELHETNSGVADFLDHAGYHARAIGEPGDLRAVSWNAFVIAVPSERRDQTERVNAFCSRYERFPADGRQRW